MAGVFKGDARCGPACQFSELAEPCISKALWLSRVPHRQGLSLLRSWIAALPLESAVYHGRNGSFVHKKCPPSLAGICFTVMVW